MEKQLALAVLLLMSKVHADTTTDQILKKYEAVKKLETKMKRAEIEDAEVYRDRGVIKEVREDFPGELVSSKYSYFYDKDKVFFVIEQRTNYAQPMMTEMEGLPKPIQAETEHRYFFEKGRMIRWLEGKKEIKTGSEKFNKRESEILDLAGDAFDNAN